MKNFNLINLFKDKIIYSLICSLLLSCVQKSYKVPITEGEYNYYENYNKGHKNAIDAIKYCKINEEKLSNLTREDSIINKKFSPNLLASNIAKEKNIDIEITTKYRDLVKTLDKDVLNSSLIYPIEIEPSAAVQVGASTIITTIVILTAPLWVQALAHSGGSLAPAGGGGDKDYAPISKYIFDCNKVYSKNTINEKSKEFYIRKITDNQIIADDLVNKYNTYVDIEKNSNNFKDNILQYIRRYHNYCTEDYPSKNSFEFDNCPLYREVYSKDVILEDNIQSFLNKIKSEFEEKKRDLENEKLKNSKTKDDYEQKARQLDKDILKLIDVEKELKYIKFIQKSKSFQIFRSNYIDLFCSNARMEDVESIKLDICNYHYN